jgi:hypothetical protein
MPDVIGETLADAHEELAEDGFDVLLFTDDAHAVDPWDGLVDERETVSMSFPEPGDDTVKEVHLWVGPEPDVPESVPQDAWYYSHGERIARTGTDACLVCHERPSCSVCHEERLQETDALLSADPANAPSLAQAVSLAADVDDVTAEEHGDGLFSVDIAWGDGDGRSTAEAARQASCRALPAGFETEPDARTIVLRWLDPDDRALVEIGMERSTFDRTDWSDVEPLDIPWIADRYAVASD